MEIKVLFQTSLTRLSYIREIFTALKKRTKNTTSLFFDPSTIFHLLLYKVGRVA